MLYYFCVFIESGVCFNLYFFLVLSCNVVKEEVFIMRIVKCVLVGDENVDKWELFVKYVSLLNFEVVIVMEIEEYENFNMVN